MSPRNNTLKYPYFDILPITKARKGYSRRIAGTSAIQRLAKQRKKGTFATRTYTYTCVRLCAKEVRLTPCTWSFLLQCCELFTIFNTQATFCKDLQSTQCMCVCLLPQFTYERLRLCLWHATLWMTSCNMLLRGRNNYVTMCVCLCYAVLSYIFAFMYVCV